MQHNRQPWPMRQRLAHDFDDSNADTYGHQELTLFNTYYSEYCYMPLFIFEGYSGRLILPILRPGRSNKRLNVFGIMRRLIERIRQKWLLLNAVRITIKRPR